MKKLLLIVLLVTLIVVCSSMISATVYDDFNRADNATVGNGWLENGVASIDTNRLSLGGGGNGQVYGKDVGHLDTFDIIFNMTKTLVDSPNSWLCVNSKDISSAPSFFHAQAGLCVGLDGSEAVHHLSMYAGGVDLGSVNFAWTAADYNLRMVYNGTTFMTKVWLNTDVEPPFMKNVTVANVVGGNLSAHSFTNTAYFDNIQDFIIDTSPPTNSSWNFTSNNIQPGQNRTIWNVGGYVNITTNLGSYTFETDENANCSSRLDFEQNYAEMVRDNANYKLATTETTSHSYTIYDNISIEEHCVYVSCIDANGNEPGNASSTSGCLPLRRVEKQINVTLESPIDTKEISTSFDLYNISFTCSAEHSFDLDNVTLYHNKSGWSAITTNSSGKDNVTFENHTFGAGNYEWNCEFCDITGFCNMSVANNTFNIDVTKNINVTLETPVNDTEYETVFDYFVVNLTCSVESSNTLSNISLYHNSTGWHLNETNSTPDDNNVTFNVSFSTESEYEWNCEACDITGFCNFSISNFTFSVSKLIVTNSSWVVTSGNTVFNESTTAWNEGGLINITSNLLSLTVNTNINTNGSCRLDVEQNYTEMISDNISYKFSTTETTNHSYTIIDDISLGNHCLYCSFITEEGVEPTKNTSTSGCLNVTHLFTQSVVQNSPADNYNNDTELQHSILFNCTTNFNASIIRLYLTNSTNENFSLNQTTYRNINESNQTVAWTVSLHTGDYTWGCNADNGSGTTIRSSNRTFKLNATGFNFTFGTNITSLGYPVNYSLINWSEIINSTTVLSGNYSWNFSESNISAYGLVDSLFIVENTGYNDVSVYLNKSEDKIWYNWTCNDQVITTTRVNLFNLTRNEIRGVNCTLDLFNISQTYVNHIVTIDNASFNFTHEFTK